MPGMLEQGVAPQQPPQPSSGPPVAQTPPSPPPQGDPGGAPGPGHSAQAGPAQAEPEQAMPQEPASQEEFIKMRDQAIQLVYGDRFDQLLEMFQSNGPEMFPRSMAVAVNTPLTELEKQGPIDPATLTKVGLAIYMRLLEDMLGKKDGRKPVVEGVTAEQVSEAAPAILMMYADSHPNVSKEDIQAVVMKVQEGVKQFDGPGEEVAEGVFPASGEAA